MMPVPVSQGWQGCIERGGGAPLHGPQPPTLTRPQLPTSMAFVTDSNRPQPLWQPPPTAQFTTSETPFLGPFPSNASLGGGGGIHQTSVLWPPRHVSAVSSDNHGTAYLRYQWFLHGNA